MVPVMVTTVFFGPVAGLMPEIVGKGSATGGIIVSFFLVQDTDKKTLHTARITNGFSFIKIGFNCFYKGLKDKIIRECFCKTMHFIKVFAYFLFDDGYVAADVQCVFN